jgi:hypothetical protein
MNCARLFGHHGEANHQPSAIADAFGSKSTASKSERLIQAIERTA